MPQVEGNDKLVIQVLREALKLDPENAEMQHMLSEAEKDYE